MNSPSSPFDALFGLGVFGVIAGVILGGLYLLFPLIVMIQLGGIKGRLDKSLKLQEKVAILTTEQNTQFLQSQKAIFSEIHLQNSLSRQLLRAYGHEPEA